MNIAPVSVTRKNGLIYAIAMTTVNGTINLPEPSSYSREPFNTSM